MNILTNFDTHRFFTHLTAAGLPPSAAEVLMQEFAHLLTTKLETDSTRLYTQILELRTEVSRWKVDILMWQGATVLLIFALVLASVIKFL